MWRAIAAHRLVSPKAESGRSELSGFWLTHARTHAHTPAPREPWVGLSSCKCVRFFQRALPARAGEREKEQVQRVQCAAGAGLRPRQGCGLVALTYRETLTPFCIYHRWSVLYVWHTNTILLLLRSCLLALMPNPWCSETGREWITGAAASP